MYYECNTEAGKQLSQEAWDALRDMQLAEVQSRLSLPENVDVQRCAFIDWEGVRFVKLGIEIPHLQSPQELIATTQEIQCALKSVLGRED